jgi:hypothetical protein
LGPSRDTTIRVEVHWADGQVTRMDGVEPGRYHILDTPLAGSGIPDKKDRPGKARGDR